VRPARYNANRIFETDREECVSWDAYFAAAFERIAAGVVSHVEKIRAIRESFCPQKGILDFDVLATVKSQLSEEDQARLTALYVDMQRERVGAVIAECSGILRLLVL